MNAMIGSSLLLDSAEGYQISRSVRLRSSANAYLDRTMTSSFTSQRIFTFSFWCKRGTLSSATQTIFDRNQSTNVNQFTLGFSPDDTFGVAARTSGTSTVSLQLITSGVFRDPSAWYHFVISVDNTQATLANRGKIYVNGVLQSLGTQTATQNVNYHLLTGLTYNIGRTALGPTNYVDGYLTEFNFIDGQQLDPSSFGETNPITGVWQPKRYAGTYGNNGFYLNFSDNSAATATTIGKDYSGNGNNWTPNNINVSAYTGTPPNNTSYDSMLDVPTQWADGGNGRGNYAVLNPLDKTSTTTTANGNLGLTLPANVAGGCGSTMAVSSGQWYVEVTPTSGSNALIGIVLDSLSQNGGTSLFSAGYGYYQFNGNKYVNGTASAYGSTYAANDVIGIALDLTNLTLTFYKNNTSQGAISIAAGSYKFTISNGSSTVAQVSAWNFGQRPFSYTPPTGFKALNTLNLPTPTILKGNQYFDATTYTGTGAALSVTNSGSMQPDLVWIKGRSFAYSHLLFDSIRGAGYYLSSNNTNAEATLSGLTSFDADGFSLGVNANANNSGTTYVGWQWKEGATQGFDIVTYTGDGVARTIAHNLGVAPKMIIVKNRNTSSYGWFVWHTAFGAAGNTDYINLNLTDAKGSGGAVSMWNNTMPTSSVFSLGTYAGVNGNTNTYVAYLFAEVAGFSKFGSYTGNGSADGPFVFCGFRPRFVMIKRTDSTSAWLMVDTVRQTYNVLGPYLTANTSDAETTGTVVLDVLSNGFKMRSATTLNASGGTYIFAAFAENPLKFSLAR